MQRLCTICNAVPLPSPWHKLCADCRKKGEIKRKRARRRAEKQTMTEDDLRVERLYGRIKYQKNRVAKLCAGCGEPLHHNKAKLCDGCCDSVEFARRQRTRKFNSIKEGLA